MIIHKCIVGTVIQKFNTETRKFIGQDFIGADDVTWEDRFGESVSHAERQKLNLCGEEEPYLNMEMIQPVNNGPFPQLVADGENDILSFEIGEQVFVTPLGDGSEPTEEFQGFVVGIKDGRYVQVRDQNNDVFDCEPCQVRNVK